MRNYDWSKDIDGLGTSPITLCDPTATKSCRPGLLEFTCDADATIDVYYTTNSAANRVAHLKVKAGSGVSRVEESRKPGTLGAVLYIVSSAGNLTGTASGWLV